jgi:hypothetical protein
MTGWLCLALQTRKGQSFWRNPPKHVHFGLSQEQICASLFYVKISNHKPHTAVRPTIDISIWVTGNKEKRLVENPDRE